MESSALPSQIELGIVGLDPSGRALACALAGRGVNVIVCERNPQQIKALQEDPAAKSIRITASIHEMMALLHRSRTIILTAADSPDSFADLAGQLEADDLLIDAGQCYFKDCERHARVLAERNIRHIAVAIIGSQDGAGRPVLMIGGRPEICQSARPLLEIIAAGPGGMTNLLYLGPPSAGHFVKMIYDGIEFTLTQLALETFDLLTQASDLEDQGLREAAGGWLVGVRQSRLRDEASRWAAQTARELGCPAPTIEAAAGIRAISDLEMENALATTPSRQPLGHFGEDTKSVIGELTGAIEAAVLITYAEALAVLKAGSDQFGFGLNVAEVIRSWKNCHGQRAAMLEEMIFALEATPDLANLLHDDDFSEKVMGQQERLRHAVWRANLLRLPAPALSATLDYLDAYRGAWMPVNLIQLPPGRDAVRLSRRDALWALSAVNEE